MQVFYTLKKTEYRTCVALGFFDGVHLGHREVISSAVNYAKGQSKSVVLTFKESPSVALGKNKKPLLNTNEQKLKLFESLGVDIVYLIDFNDIKELEAQDFVKMVLRDTLNAEFISVGFNYRFGKGGTATADCLDDLCKEQGIVTKKCLPVEFNGKVISSTRIRECIISGDIENANAMLDYDFTIYGKVQSGNHIGTKISSPTINQPLSDTLVVPKFGVYASIVSIDDSSYMGATNIGVHPTVGKTTPICETHLLNFSSGDLYSKEANTRLLHFIRPEQKFENIAALQNQIEKDIVQISAILG